MISNLANYTFYEKYQLVWIKLVYSKGKIKLKIKIKFINMINKKYTLQIKDNKSLREKKRLNEFLYIRKYEIILIQSIILF